MANCSIRSAALMKRVLMRAMAARYASAVAICVLPTPDGSSNTMFSARSMKLRPASSCMSGRGAPLGEAEVILLERLHGGQCGKLQQNLTLPLAAGVVLDREQALQEVGIARFITRRFLGEGVHSVATRSS
jgi:hypothetical protein